MNSAPGPKLPLTSTQWLICVIASIGFAFDIYELLMLPLIVGPALSELLGAAPGSPEFSMWVGRLFYIPAFAGGLFGLLGGYLTDRLGRRRVLTWSILIYAFSAFAAGFSTNVWMLLFFRCLVFVGVCVEFVAAVAWLAELFPDPERREKIIGYTQAFSSIGGLLVAVANGLCVAYAASFPAIHLPDWLNVFGGTIKESHAAWRYTLMSGIIPALPLIIIRPFLPESPAWQKKRAEGTLRRPSILDLFSPELRRTTIVTTIMFACSYGAAFGAIQHIPRIVPGLSEVKQQANAAVEKAVQGKPEADVRRITAQTTRRVEQSVAATVTKVQELGGLFGRALMAVLVVALLAGGRVSLPSLLSWSFLVSFLVLEVVGDFGGGAAAHAKRIGGAILLGTSVGLIAFGAASLLKKTVSHSAKNVLRVMQIPGLLLMPIVFAYAAVTSLNLLYVGIFL
ncbi:MAG: MFS transporter, partial [Verrucomicrobiota bacterium]